MDWREHGSIDPARMHGLPCLRGTRVPVHVVLDDLAAGESPETILDEYPSLRAEHIRAAQERGRLKSATILDVRPCPSFTSNALTSSHPSAP